MNKKTTFKLTVNSYYAIQKLRDNIGNKLKIKKDGSPQKIPDAQKETWDISEQYKNFFLGVHDFLSDRLESLEKMIEKDLRIFPIYTEWLKPEVKGAGTMMSAVIVAIYDIHEATTVSKMWQYTGFNPCEVKGKKLVEKDDGTKEIVETDTMVRGDRLTPGFLAPFNGWLRAKMCGVLGDLFIKKQNYYAMTFYYPKKKELEHSEKLIEGMEKEKMWKDTTLAHRHRAAVRYMMKMFLVDLYAKWRELEGLPVRKPYAEEKLGIVHGERGKESQTNGEIQNQQASLESNSNPNSESELEL